MLAIQLILILKRLFAEHVVYVGFEIVCLRSKWLRKHQHKNSNIYNEHFIYEIEEDHEICIAYHCKLLNYVFYQYFRLMARVKV